MVDFRFDIRPLFTQPIVKVTSNLLPHTFRGDRRQCLDATSKMSEIIDRLGQLSAYAQKLNKPVTTAQRLRMSDNQVIYMMADIEAGNNGTVLGLLKVGTKDLYLFDETGQTRKVTSTPSILDFYIHESRQRSGLGKELFETMLADEGWTPIKCSIDRPSEKLLAFLKKHYGLVRTIPQANNFVLYEGFFDNDNNKNVANQQQQQHQKQTNGGMYITDSPNTQLFGATYIGEEHNKRRSRHLGSNNSAVQITQIAPVGRYGARRPSCSMAEKTSSEVSVTPSQAAELAKQSGRKNPLDALSKVSVKQVPVIERRSGLQDVDDDYLKKNIFTKPLYSRHSGLNENLNPANQVQNLPAAGQPSIPHQHGDGVSITPSQAQFQAQQQQQQLHQQQQQQHHHHHAAPAANLTPSQIQMQQAPLASGGHHPHGKNPIVNHIIHNGPATSKGSAEPGSATPSLAAEGHKHCAAAGSNLSEHLQKLLIEPQAGEDGGDGVQENDNNEPTDVKDTSPDGDVNPELISNENGIFQEVIAHESLINTPSDDVSPVSGIRKPPTFQLSKQHTGMKNRSDGVGMAVTPCNKMEFVQEDPEEFGVLKINRPIGHRASPVSPNAMLKENNEDAMSTVSSTEGLTQQGYYDMKFFHNKLWDEQTLRQIYDEYKI